ncbi:plant invertase/pectin methylesterase inhibitor, partial [Striga asiatica]
PTTPCFTPLRCCCNSLRHGPEFTSLRRQSHRHVHVFTPPESSPPRTSLDAANPPRATAATLAGDSDSDSDDEFAFPGWIVEEDFWDRAAPMIDDVQITDGDDRNCDKVRLKLNEKISSAPLINSRIYGEIATWPLEFDLENPDPICYYRVSHLQAHTINLNPKEVVLLPLTSPEPRSPLYEGQVIYLAFSLKIDDEDIFVHGQIHNSNNLFPGEGICRSDALVVRPHNSKALRKYGGPIINRSLIGDPECDPVLMDAYYSMYDRAWTTVSVKSLLEGVSRFSGFIVARPCIFYSRICLLTVKRADEEKKTVVIQRGDEGIVGIDGSIKLTRSMVAVPCYIVFDEAKQNKVDTIYRVAAARFARLFRDFVC